MASFRRIEAVFRDSCFKWGYDEVKTPTLEYLHLFTATGTLTPGMLGRVYSFLDWDGWSGQRVVLRPDATIPVVRYYIDSLGDKGTARLCYMANSFTFEETGTENRERWQCGAELIGPCSALANVELIGLALDVLSNLSIKSISVKLSHAGLIKALLAQLDLSISEQTRLFDRLLDGGDAILKEIKPQKAGLIKMMTLLLGIKGKAAGFLRNIEALVGSSLPQLKPALDDFTAVIDLLEELNIDYQIDLASGRGFEYYTGVIFHFYSVENKLIGGGGRYDALVPLLGGRDTPAAGFALYMDHLMALVEPQDVARTGRILVCATPSTVPQAFAVADKLRQIGWVVKFDADDSATGDYGWRLDVGDKNNQIELTDLINDMEFSANSMDEVLKILGRGNVA
jgi:histidyl-tRNA synthetase